MAFRPILVMLLLGFLTFGIFASSAASADSNPLRYSNCTSSMASVNPVQMAFGPNAYRSPIQCSAPRLQLTFFGINQKAVDASPLTSNGQANVNYIQDNGLIYFHSPVFSDGTVILKASPPEQQVVELDFADPQAVSAQLGWMEQTGMISGMSAQDISNLAAWLNDSSLDTTPGDCYNGSVQSCYFPNSANSTLMWATYVPASRVQLLDNSSSDRVIIGASAYPQPGRLMALWGLQVPNISSSVPVAAGRAFYAPQGQGQIIANNGSSYQIIYPNFVPITSANSGSSGGSANSVPTQTTSQPPTSSSYAQPVPPKAPNSQPNQSANPAASSGANQSPASGAWGAGNGTSSSKQSGGKPAAGANTSNAPRYSISNENLPSPEVSFSSPASSASNQWPWWMGPAVVAALGAFFMGVMAFYYRSPTVLGPFETPRTQTEMVPPIYLSETRIALMEEISDTSRIPTDIASRLNKSKSTVVEQLEDLCVSGLAERQQTPGKKFVFYRLTKSGRHALVHSPLAKKKHSILPF